MVWLKKLDAIIILKLKTYFDIIIGSTLSTIIISAKKAIPIAFCPIIVKHSASGNLKFLINNSFLITFRTTHFVKNYMQNIIGLIIRLEIHIK